MDDMESANTYTPRSILITGGAGFIASHVVNLFVTKYPDCKITVLDKLDYCASLHNLSSVQNLSNYDFVKGNIRSADLVSFVLRKYNVDTIMHFAAQTHVDNSFGNSFDFSLNNFDGTHVLLECARAHGAIERFVHVSTDEVYGESSFESGESNKEHASLLQPTNPYAATKAGAEMLVMAYGQSYGLKYIITRGNNVYGPHQYPEKAIPKFIALLQRNQKIPIHGDGLAVRSYMHVFDAAHAFDLILHRGVVGDIYNVGAREERTVLSVARDICVIMGVDVDSNIEYVEDRSFNDRRYFIDCSKLQALGWSERKSWTDGLKETISWYKLRSKGGYWDDFTLALLPHPKRQASVANIEK